MAAILQKFSSHWLESEPEAEPVKKAYLALRDQLWALGDSGLCTGSKCKCNSVNHLVQQVCQAAAAALQNSPYEKQLLFPTPPEDQQQDDRLQARLKIQGVTPVADIWMSLPNMAARLLRGQHSPDAACSLADAFNRWGPGPLGAHWHSHSMQNHQRCWCRSPFSCHATGSRHAHWAAHRSSIVRLTGECYPEF